MTTLTNFYIEKFAEENMREVACLAVIKDGKILYGKRRDNNKWTNPGGHLEKDEDMFDGAIRELFEEAGIRVDRDQLTHLKTKNVTKPDGTKLKIHAFIVKVPSDTSTTMKDDPDNEVFRWHWIPIKDLKLPDTVGHDLHVPTDNVLLDALGIGYMTKEAGVDFRRFRNISPDFKAFMPLADDVVRHGMRAQRKSQEKTAFWKGFSK